MLRAGSTVSRAEQSGTRVTLIIFSLFLLQSNRFML